MERTKERIFLFLMLWVCAIILILVGYGMNWYFNYRIHGGQ